MSEHEQPAGLRPFRPSNGTDGESFMSAFCDVCAKLTRFGRQCPILGRVMALDVDDPDYPTEWVQDDEGARCTAFESRVDAALRRRPRRRHKPARGQSDLF